MLAERLAQIETPVLIFAGVRDRVGPLANVRFLAARLPHSRPITLDAAHFAWEGAPDEFAALVTDGRRTPAPARGPDQ